MKISKQAAIDFENLCGELEVQINKLKTLEDDLEFMSENSIVFFDAINSLKMISKRCIELNEYYWSAK
jgi:hypothetical protein